MCTGSVDRSSYLLYCTVYRTGRPFFLYLLKCKGTVCRALYLLNCTGPLRRSPYQFCTVHLVYRTGGTFSLLAEQDQWAVLPSTVPIVQDRRAGLPDPGPGCWPAAIGRKTRGTSFGSVSSRQEWGTHYTVYYNYNQTLIRIQLCWTELEFFCRIRFQILIWTFIKGAFLLNAMIH